jgi:hypothetical protein
VFLSLALYVGWFRVAASSSGAVAVAPLLYTSASQYDSEAWLHGAERFPEGAQLLVLEQGKSRALLAGFAATADANVSFDGARVLFAGKKTAKEPWQVWEAAIAGGNARQITQCMGDCVRPFYLPGGLFVYAEKTQGRFVLQRGEFESPKALQLSYAPGNAMPTDVLRDGRILFEATFPMGSGSSPEVYTVYSDGSGVEAYRCDHGPRRQAGKQSVVGDIVFASDKGMARFTSARAKQVEMKAPAGEFAGDVVQTSENGWLVAWRPAAKAYWSLVLWDTSTGSFTPLNVAGPRPVSGENAGSSTSPAAAGPARDDKSTFMANIVQPVLIAPRPLPKQHPSGLHDWAYANLLCLNAYTSKHNIPAGSVTSARLYTTDERGKPKLLGTSPVEKDGSFYVQVPGDKPLQIELLDAQSKTLQREHGWWWLRKGEQRICVGCHAGPERAPENAVPQVLVKSVKPVAMK